MYRFTQWRSGLYYCQWTRREKAINIAVSKRAFCEIPGEFGVRITKEEGVKIILLSSVPAVAFIGATRSRPRAGEGVTLHASHANPPPIISACNLVILQHPAHVIIIVAATTTLYEKVASSSKW